MATKQASFTSSATEMAVMAYEYLRGHKMRTALTTLSIVFGVGLLFCVNVILPSALESFKSMSTAVSGAADLSVASSIGESFDPVEPLKAVAAVPNVQAVSGLLRRQITLPFAKGGDGTIGSAEQIELVGVDPDTIDSVRHMLISDGRALQKGDTGKAIVPAALADLAPQIKVGATFPLITAGGLKFYTVAGLLAQRGNPTAPQIIVTLSDAQAAFNQPNLINTIEVAIKPGADPNVVSADIQKALGDRFQVGTVTSTFDAVGSLQIGFAMFDVLGLLALFVAAFLIFNTFRTVVVERRHDLGMLRAIGATRQQLILLILVEGLVQGVVGTLIGLVAGYGLAALAAVGVGSMIATYFPGLNIHPALSVSAFAGPIILGLLTTLVAGYLPARAASRISPLEALRPSSTGEVQRSARRGLIVGIVVMALGGLMLIGSQKTSALGAMIWLVGVILIAPALVIPASRFFTPLLTLWYAREGDLARGNLIRQPGRSAITASTLMIGLAVFIGIAAIVTSFDKFVTAMVDKTFSSDLLVIPPTIGVYGSTMGAGEDLQNKVRALPETETVVGLRYATSKLNSKTVQIFGIDPTDYPKVSPLDFTAGKAEEAYAALLTGRVAIINGLAASTINVKNGDDVVLETPEGPQTYHIIAIGNDLISFKVNTLFISQANLKADFHKDEDITLMINLKAGADKATVAKSVEAILKDYPQFSVVITGDYRATLLNTTVGALKLFYVMAFLILFPAILGLLNTLTINVLERTREIGVVRAVGGSRGQISRIVTAEALLLGLFGAAIGILAGIALSYGFVSVFSSIGWPMPYDFPLGAILFTLVGGVLLGLIASVLPARNAAKLDIIRALQYE